MTFKKGPVPEWVAPLAPIRLHWRSFVDHVIMEHIRRHDEVTLVEKPLWQLEPELVEYFKPDVVYVPHKEQHNFPIAKEFGPRYYMQTVFPWLFTIDKAGWGAGMSASPIPAVGYTTNEAWETLQSLVTDNLSKFDQPDRRKVPWKDFIFFPCQIPHDETIKYHSKVTVEAALEAVCQWCNATGRHLVVKGHPINPGSMQPLQEIAQCHRATWVTDYSIHDLLANCRAVFCVNSGVGIEACLHLKPIFIFGRAEYAPVAITIENMDINSAWDKISEVDDNARKVWIDNYTSFCYDTRKQESFRKLPT